jgi:antitoxin component of RelBE/YafQ-DinJ toxin-antitoxin module
MSGKNSQFHLKIETEVHNQIQREAERLGITMSELIRSKLHNPPTNQEVIILRKLMELLKK